jgi:hypothetical protein
MKKLGLGISAIVSLLFSAGTIFAQSCGYPVVIQCSFGSCQQRVVGTMYSSTGYIVNGGPVSCCGITNPYYQNFIPNGCYIVDLRTPAAKTVIAQMSAYNRIFGASCDGNLVSIHNKSVQNPVWNPIEAQLLSFH